MTVEDYLARLKANLRVGPLAKRRIVREIQAHALDAVREEEQRGYPHQEAERRAVERLGAVEDVAARFGNDGRGRRRRLVALALVGGAVCAAVAAGVILGTRDDRLAAPPAARALCGGDKAKPECLEAVAELCRRLPVRPSDGLRVISIRDGSRPPARVRVRAGAFAADAFAADVCNETQAG